MSVCPIHFRDLQPAQTRFGTRWGCTVADCTIVCWDGDTSTPADEQTRALRHECHECHERFDPLWKDHAYFRSRGAAYRWLTNVMRTPEQAHIGHFTADQCRRALAQIEKLTARIADCGRPSDMAGVA